MQNKVRPGSYINFKGESLSADGGGTRGIVSLPLLLSWGASKQIVTIESEAEASKKLGYPLTAPQLLAVKEVLKRAKTLLLYRLNVGTKATATAGGITLSAKYGGVRGNALAVKITANVDEPGTFDVSTILEGIEVDRQNVVNIAGLKGNNWVEFSGTGALVASAGIPLVGGTDGVTTAQDYLDYLAVVEVQDVNTIGLMVTDAATKEVFASFCRRQRESEGKKVQVVMENYPTADYEGVISVKNGVVLSDGSILTAAQSVAWVAGATASAAMNKSLTYDAYDGAVDVTPKYTNSQIETALKNGEFVFTGVAGRAVVEQDINSLHTFSPQKGKGFAKNRVLRVLDGINNDFGRIFRDFYLGKVSNNDDGRNLLKSEYVTYLKNLQNIEAIQNFDLQKDIKVAPGDGIDAVISEVYVQPVDSMEKLYMTIAVG